MGFDFLQFAEENNFNLDEMDSEDIYAVSSIYNSNVFVISYLDLVLNTIFLNKKSGDHFYIGQFIFFLGKEFKKVLSKEKIKKRTENFLNKKIEDGSIYKKGKLFVIK